MKEEKEGERKKRSGAYIPLHWLQGCVFSLISVEQMLALRRQSINTNRDVKRCVFQMKWYGLLNIWPIEIKPDFRKGSFGSVCLAAVPPELSCMSESHHNPTSLPGLKYKSPPLDFCSSHEGMTAATPNFEQVVHPFYFSIWGMPMSKSYPSFKKKNK